MANTYVIYTGDGTTTNFSIPFTYLDEDYVKVKVDGVETSFTFLSEYVAQVTPAPANGASVRVYRETAKTDLITTIPSSGLITGADINNQSRQALNVAEEGVEALTSALAEGSDGNLDADSRKIVNLVDPTDDQDAATKAYVDDTLAADIATITAAQTAAASSASSASSSASAAASSASAASTSETAAAASETAAAASASAAATSETNAASSATSASTSASTATTKASEASTSATNAASSASSASTSASNAASSASAAAASETAAGTSETNAATSASNASTSETNAAASAALAEDWASELEDVEVTTGKYSALHWAAKAAASAGSLTPVEDQINAATNATVADADELTARKNSDGSLIAFTWTNVKAWLKTYFDTLYATASHSHSNATTGAAGFMSAADKTALDAVGTMANRDVTISTSSPSGGSNGDIWFKVSA